MSNIAYLHAIIAQTVEGAVLYTGGDIGRDPALISGYISAFHSMDREFIITRTSTNKGFITRYHFIGDVLLIITGDDEVTVYSIFSEVVPDLIDELQEFNKNIFISFRKDIWEKHSDDARMLGIIPSEALAKFEVKLFRLTMSPPWREFISFSHLFLQSDTGQNLILYIMERIANKIFTSIGENAFWLVLESVVRENKIDLLIRRLLRIERSDGKIKVEILKNPKLNEREIVILLCKLMYDIYIKMKGTLGKNVLDELIVLKGVLNAPLH